jgi:polyribonucleotide nucleotidyltransferase
MDIKITSITEEIMQIAAGPGQTRPHAHSGEMAKALTAHRAAKSAIMLRKWRSFKIPTDKIREVIGTGGKVIREIIEETGAKVDIEDDGTIKVSSVDQEAIDKAVNMIRGITEEPEVNKVYNGKVVKIVDFGAFVNFMGGQGRSGAHLRTRRPQRVSKNHGRRERRPGSESHGHRF